MRKTSRAILVVGLCNAIIFGIATTKFRHTMRRRNCALAVYCRVVYFAVVIMSAEQIKAKPADSTRPRHPLRRRGASIVLSLVIVLSAGVVLAQVLNQPPTPPVVAVTVPAAPPKLNTVTVRRGDIQETVGAAGKLQLFKYADAYAQIAGQVNEVTVAIGDTVKANSMLVEISPTLQPTKAENNRAQMARLQAEQADQRAQLDFAELQFKRQTQLKAQNATREDAFESSRMGLSSARARVDAIDAQLRQLEATLKIEEENRQQTRVLAPIGGTVVTLAARTGQMVSAAQPAVPLLRIADLSKLTVAARVAEDDVTRLRGGMHATFTTPGYPGRHWSGKLRQVIPLAAEGSGEQGKQAFYTVLFEVNNPEHELMSGMSTRVEFVVAQAQNALLLPVKALGAPDADGLYSANVVDPARRVSSRKLKIGLRNPRQVQVLSGLAEGDQVLVGPVPAQLLHGAGVKPATTAQAAPVAS
jgi:macrolide-specific efflux system membrane fusion protein